MVQGRGGLMLGFVLLKRYSDFTLSWNIRRVSFTRLTVNTKNVTVRYLDVQKVVSI